MPTTSIDPNTTLRQLLLAMPEHGPVLACLGVNTARDGDRTLAEFCELRGLEMRTVARLLTAIREAKQRSPAVCLELMALDQLCDHLECAHRRLHDELKELDQLTKTLAEENAAGNPRLLAIRKHFVVFQRRFKAHLRKESEYLFPACRRRSGGNDKRPARFKSLLAQWEREHSRADEALADLRELVDSDSSSTARRAGLRTLSAVVIRLERCVHEQIYKENRILFPRAVSGHGVARIGARGIRGDACHFQTT